MEDRWFQRYLLNDGVRRGQRGRPLGLRPNLLYVFVYFNDCIGYMSNVFAYIIDFIDYQILVLR